MTRVFSAGDLYEVSPIKGFFVFLGDYNSHALATTTTGTKKILQTKHKSKTKKICKNKKRKKDNPFLII